MKKFSLKILSLFFVAVMIFGAAAGIDGIDLGEFAFTAEAAETTGVCGENLTWTFDDTTGELAINGEGAITSNPWRTVAYGDLYLLIKKVTINYGVTSICNQAFDSCPNLETVVLSETVKTIGASSFRGAAIRDITIPDGVTCIGANAFERCGRLITVNIGKGVETIESRAFSTCDSLLNVNFSADGNLKTINDMAFDNCHSLKTVTIPESVETIGAGVFLNCYSMEEVTFGSGVKSIGNNTWDSLENVYYTGTVADWCEIDFETYTASPIAGGGRNLYIGGELLKNLVIPDSVTEIKKYAFVYCDHLESVKIGSGVTKIGELAFSGCGNLETVDFGENCAVSEIGDRAFENCRKITTDGKSTLKIPDSVKTIGAYSFGYCYSAFENLIIGNGVTEINNGAFLYGQFTHVTIGDSVEYIWDEAFRTNGGTITDVCYTGTEEEWEAITITRGNDNLVNATRHYNYDPATHIHEHVETVTRRPNCTDDGELLYICYCGDRYTTVLPAIGHTPGEWYITLQPTCTTEGEQIKTCTVCYEDNLILERETIPATGHTPGEWRTEEHPTCTEEGEKAKYCTVCNEKLETEVIPATGHVEGDEYYDVPPTCTEDGRSVICCTICHEELEESVVPATGHTPGEWTVTVEPTTDREGKKERCCDVCGEKVEEETLAKIPVIENLINTPSSTTVNYIDTITLTVDASKIPEGGYVKWSTDNNNFIFVEDGNDLQITAFANGDTTFTATVYDADGNAVGADTQVVTSKAGLFQKIIAFFKILFGLAKAF